MTWGPPQGLEEPLTAIQAEVETSPSACPTCPPRMSPMGVMRPTTRGAPLGEPPRFAFEPKDHVDLGAQRGWMDFDVAAKLTGSRFVVLRGPLARLHRALIQFMLDLHTGEHGYTEIYVPYLVNGDSLRGTGQLPKFAADLFRVPGECDCYLIPTAEVPVTNLVRDRILEADRSAPQMVAHTPCFRSEAGAYGKDTRGMFRQHQFEKVELVQRCAPRIPPPPSRPSPATPRRPPPRPALPGGGPVHRRPRLSAAKTYDLEVWLPGQGAFREISSCCNFADFQARRLQARSRNPARQAGAAAHPQRLRPRRRPHAGRGPGELPAGRRHRADPRGPPALHGRRRGPRMDLQRPQGPKPLF